MTPPRVLLAALGLLLLLPLAVPKELPLAMKIQQGNGRWKVIRVLT